MLAPRSLPPLHALRGFEAAARCLSFTKAAQELHLTQGAVSRQVRDLESFLGVPVFHRLVRRIELTRHGEDYYRTVRTLLDELERASRELAPTVTARRLTVSALPTLASFWLMPRLYLFTEMNPGVEVHIISGIGPVNLQGGEADIAIRVGQLPGRSYGSRQPRITLLMSNDWDRLGADELFPDVLVPVCARDLVRQGLDIREPADLVRYPLIHTASRRHAWPDWLRAHDVSVAGSEQHSRAFGHFFMSLDAARSSRGVSIIPEVLLASYESRHELIQPLPHRVPSAGEYYLLVHESRMRDPIVQAFRNWILSEAAEYSREHLTDAGFESSLVS